MEQAQAPRLAANHAPHLSVCDSLTAVGPSLAARPLASSAGASSCSGSHVSGWEVRVSKQQRRQRHAWMQQWRLARV